MSSSDKNGGGGCRGTTGPCGACKFLRRKCMMEGCIFAPYFDTDQGTAHFAAVHKVFGASNASKLLMRIPAHKRLDAVVSISYEAMARIRDPVYGCVGHIFTLQQQVVNLQEELAYIQARLSSFQCLPLPPPQPAQTPPTADRQLWPLTALNSNMSMHFDSSTPAEQVSLCNALNQEIIEDGDLQALSRELVSKYWPAVKYQ